VRPRSSHIVTTHALQGTLPLRLLALEYGADLVFTEEIISLKIPQCVREWNGRLGTWDYIRDKSVGFRTHPSERDRMVFQLGADNATNAVKAAEIL
jgi:tRNA-dihydrouridine synthase 2